jgi:predicted anti-sigma-YlaC factor YlaD
MISHLTVETLSAYLDSELIAREEVRVREHLGVCPECRCELDGLRRTVGRLRALEREAPADVLALSVQRSVALEAEDRSRFGRLERWRMNLPVQSSTLLTFSLVFALATILYLFAGAMEQRRRVTIPVDLPVGERPAAQEPSAATTGEMAWSGDAWVAREASSARDAEPLEVRRGSSDWLELATAYPELAALPASDEAIVVRLGDGLRVRVEP